jgi:hypothetical protein
MADKCFLSDDWYELFSNGSRGIVSGKNNDWSFDWDRLQRWVAKSRYEGMNSIGVFLMAPWESQGIIDLFCPFKLEGDKFNLKKIDPVWAGAVKTMLDKIFEVAPVDFVVRIILFDNCQFHHNAPSPYLSNVQNKRSFYDLPFSVNKIYIDAVMGVVKQYPGKIQLSIGNELTARGGLDTVIQYRLESGPYKGDTVYVFPEAKWVWDVANYLVNEWGWKRADLGWGCVQGDIKEENGEFIADEKSLQVHVNRIAERVSTKWNEVHRELHGMCGNWTPTTMAFFARVAAKWFSDSNSGVVHISTDGDNARVTGPEYSSKTDKQSLYWRYNGGVTEVVAEYVLRHCGKNKQGKKLWLSVLPQNWNETAHIENASAITRAYRNRYGVWPVNYGKEWVKPIPPPEPPTPQPKPKPTKCGVNRWYKHLKTWNFHAAWDHFWKKHD